VTEVYNIAPSERTINIHVHVFVLGKRRPNRTAKMKTSLSIYNPKICKSAIFYN